MRETLAAAADATDEAAGDTPQIRFLRIAVAVMSLVLIVGFITVIARIIYLASRPAAQPSPISLARPAVALTPEIALQLPTGATIVGTTTLDGSRLVVPYAAPAGNGIVVLDLESGRVLSRIRLLPEAAR